MKWFQHLSDAHSDLKIEKLLITLGYEAYGVFWICDELVAKYGKGYRLRAEDGWIEKMQRMGKCGDLKSILDKLAEENLINQEAYKRGDLYMPKLKKFGDEYTKRKTVDKITFPEEWYARCLTEYQRLKGVKLEGDEYLIPKRDLKIMFKSKRKPEEIIALMGGFSEASKDENSIWGMWTMNTVRIKMPDFLAGKLKF